MRFRRPVIAHMNSLPCSPVAFTSSSHYQTCSLRGTEAAGPGLLLPWPAVLACGCGRARCRHGLSVRVSAALAGAGWPSLCSCTIHRHARSRLCRLPNCAASSRVPCRVACLLFVTRLFCKLLWALTYLSTCNRQDSQWHREGSCGKGGIWLG